MLHASYQSKKKIGKNVARARTHTHSGILFSLEKRVRLLIYASFASETKSKGELLFNGYRDFVGDDGKGLRIDSGDGYTTLGTRLMPLNCALYLRIVKMVNIVLYIFYQTEKRLLLFTHARDRKPHWRHCHRGF